MSDGYKFDTDDVGLGSEEDSGGIDIESMSGGLFNSTKLFLSPLTILSVYAFLEKAVVVGALTSLFGGASALAMAIGTTLWLVGAIVTGVISLMAGLTSVFLFVGIIHQSVGKFAIGFLGALYFGVGYLGATYVFGYLPLLVGFMLTTTIVLWGAMLIVVGLVSIGAIVVA